MLNWQHSEPPASKSGRQLGRGQEENVPRAAPPRAPRLLRGRAAAGRGVGCREQRGAGARAPPSSADGEAAPATPSRPPARTTGRQHGRRETHPSKQYHSHRKGWLPGPGTRAENDATGGNEHSPNNTMAEQRSPPKRPGERKAFVFIPFEGGGYVYCACAPPARSAYRKFIRLSPTPREFSRY